MKQLQDYFSDESIVRLLCKYRAKQSHKRHKTHMMRDISLLNSTNRISEKYFGTEFTFLQTLFPSRRKWLKLNQKERTKFKHSVGRNVEQLFKTYRFYKEKEVSEEHREEWFVNIQKFVKTIQDSLVDIDNYTINKPKLRGILKKHYNPETGSLNEYRPITIYELQDRIITSLTARYFIDFFDEYFHDCSFAFRSTMNKNNIYTHHKCIDSILNYKIEHHSLWATECDIQKFFDTVSHEHLINVLDQHCKLIEANHGKTVDLNALKIMHKFLDSFCFNYDVYSKNSDEEWWKKSRLKTSSEFKWVEKDLKSQYGETYLTKRVGVPQGNALSCFVANLLLHNVDTKVKEICSDMLFVRFCDDMIILHPDKQTCRKGLEVYKNGLIENYLIFHNPVSCGDYLKKEDNVKFWKSKSKEPYQWGNPYELDKAIPWLSFVGYQVKYTGEIRIRKQSLVKEKKKQVMEVENVLKAIGYDRRYLRANLNLTSRLSKNQITYSLHTRLISMSVGRVKIHNYKSKEQGLCWTNGFEKMNQEDNKYIKWQLRQLDNFREKQIWRLNKELSTLDKPSYNPDIVPNDFYFGSPFSYYNYIVKYELDDENS